MQCAQTKGAVMSPYKSTAIDVVSVMKILILFLTSFKSKLWQEFGYTLVTLALGRVAGRWQRGANLRYITRPLYKRQGQIGAGEKAQWLGS